MTKTHGGTSYRFPAKLFHWTVALLIAGQFIVIWVSQIAFKSGRSFRGLGLDALDLHKALGLLLVGVIVLRVLWRTLVGLPDWAPGLAEWEKTSAHKLERWLYTLMFAAPLSGILYSITSGYPIHFFGLFAIPELMERVKPLATAIWFLHMGLAYLFIAAIALHIGFVIRRIVFEKDGYLMRMWF